MSYVIFPIAIILFYWLLIRYGYRRSGEVNRVFNEYSRPARLKTTIGYWFAGITVVFLFVQWLRLPYYLVFLSRVAHLRTSDVSIFELANTSAILVILVCEWIIIVHWMIYLFYCWIGSTRYQLPEKLPLSENAPEILVLIPCCDEEPSILKRSLETVSRLRYPNYKAYLLENSRDSKLKEQAKQLAGEYRIDVLNVRNRGNKAGAMNDATKLLKSLAPYLAIIDADQRVHPDFLRDIVPYLEKDASLAFVQTPQLYENAEETWLCRTAAQQEMLLYDTIMEAKSALGRALCCGSNFIMRRSALEEVGGWDEHTVSEDLATSFLIHQSGWKSLYVRRAYAAGLGPLGLFAYWKQQKRWAVGNTGVALQVLRAFLTRKPKPVSFKIAAGYFWSAGYYVTALALAGLATLPMLLVLSSYLYSPHALQAVPKALPTEWLFLSVYPFYTAVMLFPYVHMRLRGYPVRNLIMLQGLLAITFPIYAMSVVRGLLKKVTFFEVMPRRIGAERFSLWRAPQTILAVALLVTGSLLVHRIMTAPWSSVACIALFWTFFYTISFGHYFVFAYEYRRLLKNLSKTSTASVSHIPIEAKPTTVEPLIHAEETQA